jgi:hypothetical protein
MAQPMVRHRTVDIFPSHTEGSMRRLTSFLWVSLLVAAACAGVATTNVSRAPGAQLASYQTYAWLPPSAGQAQAVGEEELRAALQRDLAQKGLTLATNAPPDFLVAYFTSYRDGTLRVDFIDSKTHRAFWHGSASGVLNGPNRPDPQKIDLAVSKVVRHYPSQMASTSRPAG